MICLLVTPSRPIRLSKQWLRLQGSAHFRSPSALLFERLILGAVTGGYRVEPKAVRVFALVLSLGPPSNNIRTHNSFKRAHRHRIWPHCCYLSLYASYFGLADFGW